MDKCLPANAGDIGSIPGLGRSHRGREGRKGRENNTRTNDSTALDKGYTVLIIKHIFTISE